ncbi:putative flavin-binding monooxygenase-like [Lyophyllum shimeji]|uniref:Flavin-binding monooxygenase-like n=1 Tax=Lyophyllum shimeji TaxID=47721 RepID=A0A9P3UP29_LYOSH|nr:putative flavin-binding monooxygenase-like [Lyophyllum shimeji]
MTEDNSSKRPIPRIVIIGAGVGGLSFAIALKRQFQFENFTIFEKSNGVGGTWWENTYPGCSSDIAVHFYSLSTDQKPDWSSSHPFQPEIQAYWEELSNKYSLSSHIVFGCKVVKAVWDSAAHLYQITTEDVTSGEQSTTTAEILISALGILEVPRLPDIPGISDFRGHLFHSARWEDSGLDGKRVAVIGNGASATQFVPIIAKRENIQITQFCRTPNWILPPIRKYYSGLHKLACRYLPLYMRTVRFFDYLGSDLAYFAIFSNNVTRRALSSYLKRYILKHSPKEYHDKLIPSYALGCKRVLFDTDYLPTLHRDNVELNWAGIASIVEDGIITKQGEHLRFDTIILATGYAADRYPLVVEGKGGETIQEYFASQGGPTAYLGTCVPGFPNFYLIGGPNTATGHTSVIFTEEVQINYALQLIKPIMEGRISYIDVTAKATIEYNEEIQERLSRSVFVGCNSWYKVDASGKITSIFPGAAALFWWWLRRPVWQNYHVVKYDEGETSAGVRDGPGSG